MKSTTKDNLYLTTNEIAISLNKSRREVFDILQNRNVKPDFKNKSNLNFYSLKKINLVFNIVPIIPIIKKTKKPYFEFASVIVESKINQNGTD
jgi:hypothetical protein